MRRITSFTCEEDLWLRFKKAALNHGCKLGEYLERILTEHLDDPPTEKVEATKKKPGRFRG